MAAFSKEDKILIKNVWV